VPVEADVQALLLVAGERHPSNHVTRLPSVGDRAGAGRGLRAGC
jgi:hypothetical protein